MSVSEIHLPRHLARLLTALPTGTELRVLDPDADPPAVEPVPPSDEAAAAIAAFDWTDAAQQQWELSRAAVAAVEWLAGSADVAAVALRVVLRDLYTAMNDERETRGLARVLEPETAARLVAAAQAGAGGPIAVGPG